MGLRSWLHQCALHSTLMSLRAPGACNCRRLESQHQALKASTHPCACMTNGLCVAFLHYFTVFILLGWFVNEWLQRSPFPLFPPSLSTLCSTCFVFTIHLVHQLISHNPTHSTCSACLYVFPSITPVPLSLRSWGGNANSLVVVGMASLRGWQLFFIFFFFFYFFGTVARLFSPLPLSTCV